MASRTTAEKRKQRSDKIFHITFITFSIILVAVLIFAGLSLINLQYKTNSLNSQITSLNVGLEDQNLQCNLTSLATNKANVFDNKMHDLLQEHTFLLIDTMRSSLGSSAEYSASLTQLKNNINEIGALLIPIYGMAATNQFIGLWNNKTTIFINYAAALKSNNPNANAQFSAAAQKYEIACAEFWSSNANAFPDLDFETVLQLVTDHMNDVKATIDAFNTKNYSLYFVKLETSYIQVGTYADTLAHGMIDQHPEDFGGQLNYSS